MVFCQMDVVGRTAPDPAARRIVANLVTYLDGAPPADTRAVSYTGGKEGAELLTALGIASTPLAGKTPAADDLIVIGPGSRNADCGDLTSAVRAGTNVVCFALSNDELEAVVPGLTALEQRQAASTMIADMNLPELAGLSNAELHWRTTFPFWAIVSPPPQGNAALSVFSVGKGRVVLCQVAPWMVDYIEKPYLRTTHRRTVLLASRLLSNLGAAPASPLLSRMSSKASLVRWELPAKWVGLVDREDHGRSQRWWDPAFNDSAWKPITVPGTFDTQREGLADYDGLFWYRIRFRIPKELDLEDLKLNVGPVDDESWIWLNGKLLGEVTKKTNPKDYWALPREYAITPDMLNLDGENVLAVRVNDTYRTGGITGQPVFSVPGAWLKSYYVQPPESVDDPYRYYRW